MSVNPHFVDISPGAQVRSGQSLFIVDSKATAETVLAKNVATGGYVTLHVTQVTSVSEGDAVDQPRPDLVERAPDYAVAQARLDFITPLIGNPNRTRADVAAIAEKAACSPATIYSWMRTYEDSNQVSSLIPSKRGPDKGGRLLDPKTEALVTQAINDNLRVPQRKRVSRVFKALKDLCRNAGVKAPNHCTVRARVRSMPKAEVLRSQGRTDEARDKYEPAIGSLSGADAPLSFVQMDHMLADVYLLDSRLRLPLQRPWVTVAMDIHTRMIVGIVISFERPSAFTAGLCISRAMLPKEGYLKKLGVTGSWPVWGAPKIVQMDNAREFRGELLRTALSEYRCSTRLRKVKTPHYGGHIERQMRTFAGALRELPGATFASPEERAGYDPEIRAVMVREEFEAWLIDYVVNTYHQSPHEGLNGLPPIEKWRCAIMGSDEAPGTGIPAPPTDPERLRLDFLPFTRRTIGRQGIRIDHIDYYDGSMRGHINAADPDTPKLKRKFLVRVDPELINTIWYLDPNTDRYVAASTLDVTRPPINRWEWKAVQRYMRKENASKVDEDSLFETRKRLQDRVEESERKTKASRLMLQRSHEAKQVAEDREGKKSDFGRSTTGQARATSVKAKPEEDEEILPFDEIDAAHHPSPFNV